MTRFLSPKSVDAAMTLLLGTLALYGLRDTFAGSSYLVAGVVGLVVGLFVAHVTLRLRQPLAVLLVLVVAAYFILGGLVALHSLGGSELLPVPHTLAELTRASTQGWKDLLTTLPPVDDPRLLALPYLLGLVAGAAGAILAERSPWAPAPVLAPVALLALGILLGVADPSRIAPTAGLFAAVTILWLVVRARRTRLRHVSGTSRQMVRRATGALLCLGAAAAAVFAGPSLPGVRADRVVLRSHVVPPFNVGQYPSPLSSFRRYTHGYQTIQPSDALYDKPLFDVSGLPAGTRVRLASLDSYDGAVWGAGNTAGSAPTSDPATSATGDDTFQKVGRIIDTPARGVPARATVTILNGSTAPGGTALGVWLPTAGDLTGISWRRPDQEQGSDNFRYNLASSTGVLPEGLAKGDAYNFSAVLPDDRLTRTTRLASGSLPAVDASPFQQLGTTWAGNANTPYNQIQAIATYLRTNGHYTDGEKGYQYYPSGQSLYRLRLFSSAQGQLAGDDEQYAAIMALTANAVGVPARVVVGAVVDSSHDVVEGKDIHAWVELEAADGSWKTLPQSQFMNTRKPQRQQQQDQTAIAASTIPPPAPAHPPATIGEPLDNSLNHRVSPLHSRRHLPAFFSVLIRFVLIPVALLVMLGGAIVGAKRWRRFRRRTRGTPVRQLALAWRDLLDHARDFGVAVPLGATRREQAVVLAAADRGIASPGLLASARRADMVMFGAGSPSAKSVSAYWAETDDLRRLISRHHSRRRRAWASLNLVTLRPVLPRMPRQRDSLPQSTVRPVTT